MSRFFNPPLARNDSETSRTSSPNRIKSFAVGSKKLTIMVVNRNGEESALEKTDFDDIKPLGCGRQGKVYATKVLFEDENGESYRTRYAGGLTVC